MATKKSVTTERKTITKFTPLARPAPMATLTSWSYSVYTDYLKCPLMVCFSKIKRIKVQEEPNPTFIKGNAIHKNADDFITGKTSTILPELKGVTDRLKLFKKIKALTEPDWSFTKKWVPTTWNDWNNCWVRIKVDVVGVTPPKPKSKLPTLVHITDWKTGKVYEEHKQQRSLYALGALQLIELGALAGVKGTDVAMTVEHQYTDTTQSATEEFTIKDLKPLRREWEERTKTMMSDTKYPAKTGFHCRWCKFRKSAGGPCPENQ